MFIPGRTASLNISLKDRESPMSLRTEGQVETGDTVEAEKQLTFTNSVRKLSAKVTQALNVTYCLDPLPSLNLSHKARHT